MFIDGAGADVGQTEHARGRRLMAIIGFPMPNYRRKPGVNIATADFGPLQPFPKRPNIDTVVASTIVNVSDAVAHLPGKMPPAGWDGEPGATSPHNVIAGA